jgi:hypothetical protein
MIAVRHKLRKQQTMIGHRDSLCLKYVNTPLPYHATQKGTTSSRGLELAPVATQRPTQPIGMDAERNNTAAVFR